jgi:hypothetical protein
MKTDRLLLIPLWPEIAQAVLTSRTRLAPLLPVRVPTTMAHPLRFYTASIRMLQELEM